MSDQPSAPSPFPLWAALVLSAGVIACSVYANLSLMVTNPADYRFFHCWPQLTVIVIYLSYLLPFIVISYYERYAVPLLAVKVLLVFWAIEKVLRHLGRRERSAEGPGTER